MRKLCLIFYLKVRRKPLYAIKSYTNEYLPGYTRNLKDAMLKRDPTTFNELCADINRWYKLPPHKATKVINIGDYSIIHLIKNL